MRRGERVEPAQLAEVLLRALLERWPDAADHHQGLRDNLVMQVEETNADICTIGDGIPLFRLMHESTFGVWDEEPDPLFPAPSAEDPLIEAPGTAHVPPGRWRLQRAT